MAKVVGREREGQGFELLGQKRAQVRGEKGEKTRPTVTLWPYGAAQSNVSGNTCQYLQRE